MQALERGLWPLRDQVDISVIYGLAIVSEQQLYGYLRWSFDHGYNYHGVYWTLRLLECTNHTSAPFSFYVWNGILMDCS
jgi:hypothetical protein